MKTVRSQEHGNSAEHTACIVTGITLFESRHSAVRLSMDRPFSFQGEDMPDIPKPELQHDTDSEDCWCEPQIIVYENGNKVIIHQEEN